MCSSSTTILYCGYGQIKRGPKVYHQKMPLAAMDWSSIILEIAASLGGTFLWAHACFLECASRVSYFCFCFIYLSTILLLHLKRWDIGRYSKVKE
jgi:hypothetical protein